MSSLTWHQGGIAIMAAGMITLLIIGAEAIADATRRHRDGRPMLPIAIAGVLMTAVALAMRWALHALIRATGGLLGSGQPTAPDCDRCTDGADGLPCACRTDCGAPACLGWLDDDLRDMARGDA